MICTSISFKIIYFLALSCPGFQTSSTFFFQLLQKPLSQITDFSTYWHTDCDTWFYTHRCLSGLWLPPAHLFDSLTLLPLSPRPSQSQGKPDHIICDTSLLSPHPSPLGLRLMERLQKMYTTASSHSWAAYLCYRDSTEKDKIPAIQLPGKNKKSSCTAQT